MSVHKYTAGLHNVGSYQVSGRPFTKATNQGAGVTTITFPKVTKQIVFLNRGANDMLVYFHVDSLASNKLTIAAGDQHTFDVKCKQIYTSGTNGQGYTLYASLTHIPEERMYNLTGSGVTE
jgi:hypothetical protein